MDKRYRVELSRIEYRYATVEVWADSEEEAKERAQAEVNDLDFETSNANEEVDSVELIDDDQ